MNAVATSRDVIEPLRPAKRPGEIARLTLQLLAAVATFAGAAGWTQAALFSVPGLLKYVATIVGPLLLLIGLTTRRPIMLLGPAAVVVAHLQPFVVTLMGVPLTPVLVLATATFALLLVIDPPTPSFGYLRYAPAALAVTICLTAAASGSLDSQVEVLITATVVAGAVALSVAADPRSAIAVAWTAVTFGVLQAALAVSQYLTGTTYSPYAGRGSAAADDFFAYGTVVRPKALLPDPISLGTILAAACPLALWLCLRSVQRRHRVQVVLAAGSLGILTLGTALTLSRMSTIGCLAGLLVTAFLAPRGLRGVASALVLGVTMIGTIGVGALGGTAAITRAASVLAPTDPTRATTASGDQDRLAYWQVGLKAFQENPLFGLGPGRVNAYLQAEAPDAGIYTHTHSLYVQIVAEAGAIGAGALLVVVVLVALDLRRARRVHVLATAALIGSAVVVCVSGSTDVVVLHYAQVAGILAALLGIATGLAAGTPRSGPDAPPTAAPPQQRRRVVTP